MKTVSCIPGISQQKTFNYSWLSCPFILWLNIFTVKKPSKSDNVNLIKTIQFLQLLYENTFSKIIFKGKVIECIFDFSLLIHDFFLQMPDHIHLKTLPCCFINYLGITLFIHGFFSFCFQKQIHVFICSFITMKHVGVSLVFQKRYDIISLKVINLSLCHEINKKNLIKQLFLPISSSIISMM